MANGWESKSIEAQQADQEAQQADQEAQQADQEAEQAAASEPALSPETTARNMNDTKRRATADAARKRQALELQRERILSERTSSPHRRSALQAALQAIELEIEHLGNMVHL